MRTLLRMVIFCLPFCLIGQQELTKKELREQRKKEKIAQQKEKLIQAVLDTTFNFYPFKIKSQFKTGNDGGMFTISKSNLTFFNVLMPISAVDAQKRIDSYFTSIQNFSTEQDQNLGELKISLVFQYKKQNYNLIIEHKESEKWALGKLFGNSRLLATYEGPLKP